MEVAAFFYSARLFGSCSFFLFCWTIWKLQTSGKTIPQLSQHPPPPEAHCQDHPELSGRDSSTQEQTRSECPHLPQTSTAVTFSGPKTASDDRASLVSLLKNSPLDCFYFSRHSHVWKVQAGYQAECPDIWICLVFLFFFSLAAAYKSLAKLSEAYDSVYFLLPSIRRNILGGCCWTWS